MCTDSGGKNKPRGFQKLDAFREVSSFIFSHASLLAHLVPSLFSFKMFQIFPMYFPFRECPELPPMAFCMTCSRCVLVNA